MVSPGGSEASRPRLWVAVPRGAGGDLERLFAPVSQDAAATPPAVRPDCLVVDATGGDDPGSGAAPVLLAASDGAGRRLGGLLRSARPGGAEPVAVFERLGQLRGTELAVRCESSRSAAAVVDAARVAGLLERLWVLSPALGLLEEVRSGSPATRLLHECDPAREPRGSERHAAVLRSTGIEGVMVRHDRASAGLAALLGRFGRLMAASGAEYPRMVRAAVRAGVQIVSGPDAGVLAQGLGPEPGDTSPG